MSRLLLSLALVGLLGASGCTMSNEYGECRGLATESEQSPGLRYEVKTMNVVLAVIFSETILWPVLTAMFWLRCPTGPVK